MMPKLMHSFCAVLLLAFLVHSHSVPDVNRLWEEWKHKHDKSYRNQTEFSFRRAVWEKNLHLVMKHNQNVSMGNHSFTLGLNHLSDMVKLLLMHFSQNCNGNTFSEINALLCMKCLS
uniref:Cathepsin propeptide inhibitor domain-containing protein n=1 Tax=Oryzias melastigma TaxID=30732 RepID=A0A3B3CPA0_ORYME